MAENTISFLWDILSHLNAFIDFAPAKNGFSGEKIVFLFAIRAFICYDGGQSIKHERARSAKVKTMRKNYHKLVRDRIPAIIRRNGGIASVRILSGDDYQPALKAKLAEETDEYLRDETAEELADILEVVYALAACHGLTADELERLREEKAETRGGFAERVFLDFTEDQS